MSQVGSVAFGQRVGRIVVEKVAGAVGTVKIGWKEGSGFGSARTSLSRERRRDARRFHLLGIFRSAGPVTSLPQFSYLARHPLKHDIQTQVVSN